MTELSALVRFFQLAAAVLLAGSFAFLFLIARPAARRTDQSLQPLYCAFVRRQVSLMRGYLIVLFITAGIGLWLQVLAVNTNFTAAANPTAVISFLSETHSGNVWLVRIILVAFLAAVIFSSKRQSITQIDNQLLLAGFVLSVVHLAAMALAGHAAAAEGSTFALQASIHSIHIMCSGLWLGGLLPLASLLAQCQRSANASAGIARDAVRRFSSLAFLCVVALICSGSYNAWNWVGGMPQLFGTAYGQLLLVKIAILIILLAVSAANRFKLKPALLDQKTAAPAVIAKLRRNVLIETILGMAILLIVGHMSVTPPARHIQPDWPFAFRWNWSALEKAPKARAEVDRGFVWAAVGAAALVAASLRRRRRITATLLGVGALAYGGAVIDAAVSIDAYPATYLRPAIAYQAISVANGKSLYQESGCGDCHGGNGYGDGPAAAELKPKPADLTAPHANTHTAGDLYWWLSHGVKPTSAMPGFSQSLSDEERWDLINYLRALSNGEKARSLAPVIDNEPWLVAPDFTYGTSDSAAGTLKDHRGSKVVLLVLFDSAQSQTRLTQLNSLASKLSTGGLETILVPHSIARPESTTKLTAPIVTEGGQEIADTYKLFARTFADENLVSGTPHVEFLIDRQGYIRARWLPKENQAWQNLDALRAQIEQLTKEPPRAPAPDDHVH